MEGRGKLRSIEELCDAVRSAERVRIIGSARRSGFLPSWDGAILSLSSLSGVIAHDVADQVVEVWAGTGVQELQEELGRHGQCLPLASGVPLAVSQQYGTVGGLLATNLPHALSAQCGGPRDWTLGMTVVRTDGTIAKCGSKAVKSVAGYDAHKLFVGSRGTLCAIAKVILRTLPTRALPDHQVELFGSDEPKFVARTLRTDYESTKASAGRLVAADPASCTIWGLDEPPLPVGAWMLGPRGAIKRQEQPNNLEASSRTVFDPGGKLAPGWQE
jgi:glycolate oxidase FAD binding subunit